MYTCEHEPAILILDIYQREMKAHAHTKNCKQMFIEALFVIPQDLK